MKKHILLFLIFLVINPIFSISLKEVYEVAEPGSNYDKFIELETGVTYTGGLLIGNLLNLENGELEGDGGYDVKIQGNGAILDLDGQEICISYCGKRLDIEDCVIIHGNIRFKGINSSDHIQMPTGSVSYVTFYDCHDYAIRIQGAGQGVLLERNIAVNAIDTGLDFIYVSGCSSDWLPTGINYAPSGQFGFYGVPEVKENFSYFEDIHENMENINHFTYLCEYG